MLELNPIKSKVSNTLPGDSEFETLHPFVDHREFARRIEACSKGSDKSLLWNGRGAGIRPENIPSADGMLWRSGTGITDRHAIPASRELDIGPK